jgi:hypothetical protein
MSTIGILFAKQGATFDNRTSQLANFHPQEYHHPSSITLKAMKSVKKYGEGNSTAMEKKNHYRCHSTLSKKLTFDSGVP